MSNLKTRGIIIKQTNFNDYDRIFTIISEDYGKIQAIGHGVRRFKNPLSFALQPLYFCSFTLTDNRRELLRIDSAEIIESFYPLRSDIIKTSYGFYLGEFLSVLSSEQIPEPELLKLFLNTLHKLTYTDMPPDLLRCVFELKAMSLSGMAPYISACGACGKTDNLAYFDPISGNILCGDCNSPKGLILKISPAALKAFSHILTAPPQKLFSFSVPEQVQNEMVYLLEQFIKYHIDKDFKTLDFLKTILN